MLFIILIVCLVITILCVSLITYFVNKKENPNPEPPVPPIPPEPTKDVLVAVGIENDDGFISTLKYSSDNGTTWIGLGNDIFTQLGSSVFWYKGKWVATGQGVNSLAYSNDGINWTPSESGNAIFNNYGVSVYHNGVKWLAIGSGVNNIAVSDDGENWVGKSSLNSLYFLSPQNIVYANQRRFFITNSNNLYYSDDNGETWKTITVNSFQNYKISCNENKCLISGGNGPSNSTMISYDNGKTWTDEISILENQTLGLYNSSNIWLISLYFSNIFKISNDNGENWSSIINGQTNIISFYKSKNRWFYYGNYNSPNSNIWYSEDLLNWNSTKITTSEILNIY